MTENKLTEEEALAKAYNAAFVLIAELQDEAAELLTKYGERSGLVKKKIAQIEAIKSFYKFNQAYINSLRDLNFKMAVNYQTMELVAMKHETGLPWAKIGDLLGHNKEQFKKLDNVERIFTGIRESLAAIERVKSLTTSDDGNQKAGESQ
jgi:hypothetical protein